MGFIGIASVLESPRGNTKTKIKKENKVLVFGHANMSVRLKKLGIDTEYYSSRPNIKQLGEYCAVLAISDDDMENMRLCVEAMHEDESTITVMRCTDNAYVPALKDAKVKYIVPRDVTAESLADIIRSVK